MPEYVGNLHIHTLYSDGALNHEAIAEAALTVGLDFLIFTDHNVLVKGIEGFYGDEERGYVLLLGGEEIHDAACQPQCNHLLVYGVGEEVAPHAVDLQGLINAVGERGGLSFIAHPDDHAVTWLHEPEIAWRDRHVQGFTGLEVWNYMSRLKDYLQRPADALRNIFRPEEVIVGPEPATLALWDELLAAGRPVVGIGSADAHGTRYQVGPLAHTVFPYDFLFSCVNTHILTRQPLTGDLETDRSQVYQALREGRAFIGYEIPGSTHGFRFTAQGQNTSAMMGESVRLGHGVTLQTLAPARARIRIVGDGEVVAEEHNVENLTHVVRKPGAYRVEVWRAYHRAERAWILSNPIYVLA
jgi:hypothetical protein